MIDTVPPQCVPQRILEEILKHESQRLEIPFHELAIPEYSAYWTKWMSDSPGYVGPLVVVVWAGGTDMVSMFIVQDGNWIISGNWG